MQITIEGEDRSALYTADELDGFEIEMLADQGQVGIGSAPVPTYDSSEEAYSGQQFLVESDGVTILDGFVGAMNRDRNGTVSGTRLTFHYGILDENALLGGHRAVSWVRPAETDRARMLAANAAFLSHLSLDTSMVLNTNLETLPAKTYMTEDIFGELQTDCGDPTAKDLYIENRRLHWHRQTEGDAAGLTIVATGANRTTTFELDSSSPPQRSKDGMDLGVDVLARNGAGLSYTATDATAQTRHDSAGMRHQRLIEQESASLAQLTVLANRMLATYKAERITYEGVIGPLTSAQVALIRPGMVITATDAVWGLSGSSQRIAGVRLKYKHPDRWMATLSLGYAPRLRVKPLKETVDSSVGTGRDTGPAGDGTGGGRCDGCPPWVCAPTEFGIGIGPAGAVSGAVLILNDPTFSGTQFETSLTDGALGGPYPQFTLYASCVYRMTLTVFHATGSGWLNGVGVIRVGGGGGGDLVDMGGPAGDPVHPPVVNATADWTCSATASDYILMFNAVNTIVQNSYTSSAEIAIRYVSGPDPRYVDLPACTNPDPVPGQPIAPADTTGDGTTTAYTTTWPIMPGSLQVWVSGLDWSNRVIETDLATGNYALDYAPSAGSTIRVGYQRGPIP